MKSKSGKKTNSVTYDQHEFLNAACVAGYKAVVVYNYDAFSDLLKWYFGEGE